MIQTIFKDDIPVQFHDAGDGDVLVFLHGHLESKDIWTGFTEAFESDYRVIRIDLPGHGGSGIFGPVSNMDIMAEAVKAVLDSLNIEKAVFFGHSMGGYTALAGLELYPEMFNAVSLFHSHTKADSQEVKKKRDREIKIIERGHKSLLVSQNIPNMYADDNLDLVKEALARSIQIGQGLSEEGITAAIRGLKARPDRSAVLENASIPCLNIIGKKDNYIDFEMVSMQTSLPPGSSILILENSGHMGFIEEAEKARKGIFQFLKSIG